MAPKICLDFSFYIFLETINTSSKRTPRKKELNKSRNEKASKDTLTAAGNTSRGLFTVVARAV